MSRAHRKYLREEKAKDDLKQAYFSSEGSLETSRLNVVVQETGIPLDKIVMCPFCLVKDRLQLFLVSTRKGISHSRADCPNCKTGMLMRSLLTEWNPESFAEWVFDYAHSGYWKKISWDTWKMRLSELGWDKRFWDRYNELKAELSEES